MTLTYVLGQKADKSLAGAIGLPSWHWCKSRIGSSGFARQRSCLEGGDVLQRVAVCLFVSSQCLSVLTFAPGGGILGRKRELCKYCSELQLPTSQRSVSWHHRLLFISSSSSACMSLCMTLLTCAWQVSCILPQSCQEKAEELTASACSLSVQGVCSR